MAQPEKEYYRSGNVLVTNARAEMGGRTFAMANVTAVSMATITPQTKGCALQLLLGGAGFALITLIAIVAGRSNHISYIVIGLLMAGTGFVWRQSLKVTYAVNLGSASGESRAMESKNRAEIERIVAAIKRAIIERG